MPRAWDDDGLGIGFDVDDSQISETTDDGSAFRNHLCFAPSVVPDAERLVDVVLEP